MGSGETALLNHQAAATTHQGVCLALDDVRRPLERYLADGGASRATA